jgi:DNA primase
VIPPSFLQELLSRIDVVEVVGRHVELRKAGALHKGLCPFHAEKSPSFTVSPARQTYHCFGCGVHGDALRFLTEYAGLGFIDAVHELAGMAGLTVPEDSRSPEERAEAAQRKERQATLTEVLQRASEHYRKQLKASPKAIGYLKGRGLTGEVAGRFAMGYAPEGWRSLASAFPRYDDPQLVEAGLVVVQGEDRDPAEQKRYDRFRDRVMFPIRAVTGEVIGFGGRVLDGGEPKYLNSPETPVFVKGRELYGLFEARQAMRTQGYALVVEGYMDVVALAQLGFPNAVATLGTACTEEHVRKLFRFTDSVVFSFDGDTAGRRAATRALEAALPHATDLRTVRFLFLPPEHDPDSYIRALGAEAFERQVAAAVPLSRQLIETARDHADLGTAEGRARFLAQARPLWQALPEGALRSQLLGELAELGRLPTDELLRLWGAAPAAPPAAPPAGGAERRPWRGRDGRDRTDRRPPGPPLRVRTRQPADNVAQLLLLRSDWWHELTAEVHEQLCALPGWHAAAFAWLDRHLQEHGHQPWPALRMALPAEPWAAHAAPLADEADPVIEPLREDLDQALHQLRRALQQADIDKVLGRR